MLKTDYSKIAAGYDRSPLRRQIAADSLLETLFASPGEKTVVDLGCGTGNYLAAQTVHFAGASARWIGVDLSPEMLDQARSKDTGAELLLADAGALPLPDESVDFIKVRFAHHHFPDKRRAFAETFRVLRPGGTLSVVNICHEYSRRTWVYQYFPTTEAIDRDRFPATVDFHALLTDLGFTVDTEVTVKLQYHRFDDVLTEAGHRDMSQLTLIGEAEYQAGLEALARDSRTGEGYWGDVALVSVTAVKPTPGNGRDGLSRV